MLVCPNELLCVIFINGASINIKIFFVAALFEIEIPDPPPIENEEIIQSLPASKTQIIVPSKKNQTKAEI